jgi:hypothetical protein
MVGPFTGGNKVLSDVDEGKRCLDHHENVVLDQWKAQCNMSDVIDDLLIRVIEQEPVDWRYHIGDDVFVMIDVGIRLTELG